MKEIIYELAKDDPERVKRRSIFGVLALGGTLVALPFLKNTMNKKPIPKPKTSIEKMQDTAGAVKDSIKDSIKDKIMEHPKTAAAVGVAGALGAGYGAYKYLKNIKNKKK